MIFLSDNFFSSSIYEKKNGGILFKKIVLIDSSETILSIYFENKPLLLRKITSKTDSEYISISFNEHNYNSNFKEDLFSFVPIYID